MSINDDLNAWGLVNMYIIKRRALSLLLSFSMILGIMQMFTLDAFAADPVNYQPMVAEYAILNRFIYQNKDYFSTYVKNSNLYNAVESSPGLNRKNLPRIRNITD
jgi:hypothetical protein